MRERVEAVSDYHGDVAEQDGNARTMSTTLGATFHIHLWEDRTRGEIWVPAYDPKDMALVSDEFLRIASGNAVDSGQRSFEFQACAAGTHELVFEKRMGWKFTAEDRCVFFIHVSGDTPGAEAK